MTLPEWLDKQKWTNRQLAKAIGVTEECARLYRAGLRRPGPVLADRIAVVTNDAVRPVDMYVSYVTRKAKKDHTTHGTLGTVQDGAGHSR